MRKNIFLITCIVALATSLVSCHDDEGGSGCTGAPVVTGVKYTLLDTVNIETGALGDWIIIEGVNFCDINAILFNDVNINMHNIYLEPGLISAAVPRVAPFVVNNMITLVTPKDTVLHPFELEVPPIVVRGLLNEYVEAGESGYIEGENFDIHQVDSLDGAWITFGDVELGVHRVSATRLRFKVPEDAQPNTAIHLYRRDTLGNTRVDTRVPGFYMDTRNILYSGDPAYDKCGTSVRSTDGQGLPGFPLGVNGLYYYFQGDYPAWAYAGLWGFYGNLPPGQIWGFGPYDTVPNSYIHGIPAEEIEVVFEVNVVNDWVATEFRINLFDGYWYHWKPYGTSAYRTNGWETIRIPFTEFKKPVGTGDFLPTLTDGNIRWDWKGRNVLFNGVASPNVFICWDNLRIVPKVYE